MRGAVDETIYPFSALVGQPLMKRALILAAIHPGLGGVLIRGSKGAAKSTAVRALAALLPEIEVFDGDPFHRAPGESIPGWPLADAARLVRRPVALVNLPVGATDDRVVGSLNIERALTTGQQRFEPGLLAAAHRGILYIDEVNLLGDHLVDLLLDAAAMGVNHVEREGLAFRHPARFVLVGTMNPEEGDLRPQLLDRFGLAVEVEPMNDPRDRAEVVRRRLAFEGDPEGFRSAWKDADRLEGERIAAAQKLLPSVEVPEAILKALCERCASEGAEGLRADLTIYKAATALAAYEGRTSVVPSDIDAVAELALAHRRTRPPQGTPPPPSSNGDDRSSSRPPEPQPKNSRPPDRGRSHDQRSALSEADDHGATNAPDDGTEMQLIAPMEPELVARWLPRPARRRTPSAGRRGRPAALDRLGATIGATVPTGRATDPALAATLRAAAPRQADRGRASAQNLILVPHDLRVKVRARPVQNLILFVVDASRSMGARERMRQTKSAVLSLLIDAYQKRDKVGLITFGKGGAHSVLAPTRSVHVAAGRLSELPIGGATPLAAGLHLARRVVESARRREPGVTPMIVLLSDGRANVPFAPGGDPEREAMAEAARLRCAGVVGLIVDTETGPVRVGMARALAEAWGADLKNLDELAGTKLPEAIRRVLLVRIA
jgi:magnesium chelatase subunit D